MYQEVEMWKEHIKLRDKISKEFGLDKLITKKDNKKEFDNWMKCLIKKNGVTKL